MVAKGTPHIFCTTRLCRQLDRLLGDVWRQAASRLRAVVPCQEPIILPSDSEPEPDVAIARGNETDYLPHHPCVLDLIISSDGDIPLLMRAGDGNEADKAVFGKILVEFKKQINFDSIMVCDSALYSQGNLH